MAGTALVFVLDRHGLASADWPGMRAIAHQGGPQCPVSVVAAEEGRVYSLVPATPVSTTADYLDFPSIAYEAESGVETELSHLLHSVSLQTGATNVHVHASGSPDFIVNAKRAVMHVPHAKFTSKVSPLLTPARRQSVPTSPPKPTNSSSSAARKSPPRTAKATAPSQPTTLPPAPTNSGPVSSAPTAGGRRWGRFLYAVVRALIAAFLIGMFIPSSYSTLATNTAWIALLVAGPALVLVLFAPRSSDVDALVMLATMLLTLPPIVSWVVSWNPGLKFTWAQTSFNPLLWVAGSGAWLADLLLRMPSWIWIPLEIVAVVIAILAFFLTTSDD